MSPLTDRTAASADRPPVPPPDPRPAVVGESPGAAAPGPDRVRYGIAAAFAVGLALRALQYLGGRSLWLDEAWLAPLVTERSLGAILDPRTSGPVPSGFLVLTKLVTLVAGTSEYALRLLPFLAGLASLYLFFRLARRLLSPAGAALALGLFAASPFLIYYSSEFKQYSVDVLVSIALLLAGTTVQGRRPGPRRMLYFGLFAPLAVWISFPAAFVLAGVVASWLVSARLDRDPAATRTAAFVAGVWGLAGLGLYLLVVRGVAADDYARAFWRTGFAPFPPRSVDDLLWYAGAMLRVFRDPLGLIGDAPSRSAFYVPAAGMLAFTAGCLGMWATARGRLALLVAPVLFTLAASALHRYPFGGDLSSAGRVVLFLVPLFFLVMGEGLEQLRGGLSPALRGLWYPVAAILLLCPLAQALVLIPYGRSELKPVLAHVREHFRPGDVLYVHYDARQTFSYYAPRYGFQPGDYLLGPCARFEPQRYLEVANGLRGRARVWFVFEPGVGAHRFDEKQLMLGFLDAVGRRLDQRFATGTSVYLYDLRAVPGRPDSYRAQIPTLERTFEDGCGLWGR